MSTPSPFEALRARLPELMPRDEHRLRRRLDGARKARDRDSALARIAADVDAAELRLLSRRESVPKIEYPEELPVSRLKDEIGAAIAAHQVVIVAGETGSGKTTQLPKICLELGRGVRGQIGHTQPRRLAARTVADRIASELKTELGDTVGYKVRFTDQSGQDTLVKLMTDGILLAEIQTDRSLRQYDTLIIDEAHERSLNIDFILGYLKQLLPRRPDLKVIITSATIDPERFSKHFDNAPIVEVSGRTYPVEVRYRPLVDPEDPEGDDERDQTQGILEAVEELCAEGPGDVLVFLSGEREIRDTADVLNRADLRGTEVLPLYARLSAADQHRVFQQHTGRRVVLATNVAETSLTVPGIKYVVDPGTARISRYSHRTKVQRLPIEPVSQASANQRKGRCGRTSDGICIRLYSEDDFEARPEFTDPEILRTNLASVILQMTSLGLGDIAAFPFVEPPDRRQVTDGIGLLQELGAFDSEAMRQQRPAAHRDRPQARAAAGGPADGPDGPGSRPERLRPRSDDHRGRAVHPGPARAAVGEAAAGRPAARAVRGPDVGLPGLPEPLGVRRRAAEGVVQQPVPPASCRNEYLNYLRVREWQDIFSQLRQLAKPLGISLNTNTDAVDPQKVHTSLIAGLLSHIGLKDPAKGDYLGARGARFGVFPGSALFKKQPRWVMSAELVETSRLWARVNARIEPEWVEPLAQHVVKRNYSEPHWERKQGAVIAIEKVTLYGVPLIADRRVNYGRIDPEMSRALFIRHALVEGDWQTRHHFFAENRALLEEVEDLENRARRRDILVDDQTLYEFYDSRVPADVVSVRHFDTWWKKTRHEQPDLLSFEKSMLINETAGGVREGDYPDSWTQGTQAFALTYQFEPGADADGVTVHIPLPVLNQVTEDGFDWQVPGLRSELVTQLIKSLPKAVRRNFVPAPDTANYVLSRVSPSDGPLLEVLGRELRALRGITIPFSDWDLSSVPDHLKVTFRVVDERGKRVAEGKDISLLRLKLAPKVRETISKAANSLEKAGLTKPSFGSLPRVFASTQRGHDVKAYPALVDEGATVAVRMLDTPAQQEHAMWAGTRRMLRLNLSSPMKFITRSLSNSSKLVLNRNPHGSVAALLEDCVDCAVDALMATAGGPAFDEAGFASLLEKVRGLPAPDGAGGPDGGGEDPARGERRRGGIAFDPRPGGVPGGRARAAVIAGVPGFRDGDGRVPAAQRRPLPARDLTAVGEAGLGTDPRPAADGGHRVDHV